MRRALLTTIFALLYLPAAALAVAPQNNTVLGDGSWRADALSRTLDCQGQDLGPEPAQFRLNDGPEHSAANQTALVIASDGQTKLETRCVNQAGEASGWQAETVRIDLSDPRAAMLDPGQYLSGIVTFRAKAYDSGSGVAAIEFDLRPSGTTDWQPACQGQGQAPDYSCDFDTASVSDGNYDFSVLVTDGVGHTLRALLADAPTNVTLAGSGDWRTSPLARQVSCIDSGTGLAASPARWRLDGGPEQSGSNDSIAEVSKQGTTLLETRCVAGDEQTASEWQPETVRYDGTAPADLSDAGDGTWRRGAQSVTLACRDDVSGLPPEPAELRLDGAASPAYAEGSSLSVAARGQTLVETRCQDVAGNLSGWRGQTVRIDPDAPSLSLAAPQDALAGQSLVTLSASDALSGLAGVKLGLAPRGQSSDPGDAGWDQSWPSCSATPQSDGSLGCSLDLSALPDGSYELRATALDNAGNSARALAAAEVDNPAPIARRAPAVLLPAVVARQIICERGLWDYASATTVSWLRDGRPIAGQASAFYTVRRADLGHKLSCRVRASGGGGQTDADSPQTAKVAEDTSSPVAHLRLPGCKAARCIANRKTLTGLDGAVEDARPSSGARSVELTLTTKNRAGRCLAWSGSKLVRCGKRALWLKARLDPSWNFHLPVAGLPAGRYTVTARASDRAGHRQSRFPAGRSKLTLILR